MYLNRAEFAYVAVAVLVALRCLYLAGAWLVGLFC